MNKDMKLAALEAMVGEGEMPAKKTMGSHEATCPKCGYTWEMGGEEESNEYEED